VEKPEATSGPCYVPAVRSSIPLSLPVAVVLLVGCGASEEEKRFDAFCEQAPSLLEEVGFQLRAVPSGADNADEVFAEQVTTLESVQAPEGVADEWDRLLAAMRDMRDLVGRADLTDPSANAGLAPELERLQPELVDAGTAVDDWGKANC
jgi:hypothetical protein